MPTPIFTAAVADLLLVDHPCMRHGATQRRYSQLSLDGLSSVSGAVVVELSVHNTKKSGVCMQVDRAVLPPLE